MKKIELLILFVCLGVTTILAQNVVDFEDLNLDPESHWDGSDLSGSYTSGWAEFYNNYDEAYLMWDGFAYTNEVDNITYDWQNSFSSAAGSGVYGSDNYAVSWINSDWMNNYQPIPSVLKIDTVTAPEIIPGMYLSLNANSSLYMEDGDFYAINDHWFTLRIIGYSTTSWYFASRDFVLADYRFENDLDGFKMDTWNYVDMTWAEGTDSLCFIVLSSDEGEYGVNTPAYFCIDNFGEEVPVGVSQLETEAPASYTIAVGGSTDLIALAKGGVQPYYFQWSNEEGLDYYEIQNPVASPAETTIWTVTITDAIGNESVESVTVNVTSVSVAESMGEELMMFFNQNGNLTITNSQIIDKVIVYDITGKTVIERNVFDYNSELNFNQFSDGIYIVNAFSNGNRYTRKLVK